MSVRLTRKPALPTPPTNLDPALRSWLIKLKEGYEVMAGIRGDSLDRAVTHREQVDLGLTEEVLPHSGRLRARKITKDRLAQFHVTQDLIAEQSIGTRAIMEEAVSTLVHSFTASALALTNTHQTAALGSIEATGRPITIWCSAILNITSSNTTTNANIEVRLTEDGTVVWGPFGLKAVIFSGATGTVRNAEEGFAIAIQRTPGLGPHNYAFQARIAGTITDVIGSAVARSIVLEESKR